MKRFIIVSTFALLSALSLASCSSENSSSDTSEPRRETTVGTGEVSLIDSTEPAETEDSENQFVTEWQTEPVVTEPAESEEDPVIITEGENFMYHFETTGEVKAETLDEIIAAFTEAEIPCYELTETNVDTYGSDALYYFGIVNTGTPVTDPSNTYWEITADMGSNGQFAVIFGETSSTSEEKAATYAPAGNEVYYVAMAFPDSANNNTMDLVIPVIAGHDETGYGSVYPNRPIVGLDNEDTQPDENLE